MLRDRLRRFVQNAVENDRRSIPGEGLGSSSGFVQHDAEGEKISASVELLAACLFRRHVRDGAERTAGTGEIG